MPLEALGWFLMGAGTISIIAGITIFGRSLIAKRRLAKFNAYIEQVRNSVPPELHAMREVSELTFRDKTGILNTVRIVIDPGLHDMETTSQEEFQELLDSGQAGTLESLIEGHSISEDEASRVQEFVFTPNAVKRMREAGIEPDEVVTKMLRASGRIA